MRETRKIDDTLNARAKVVPGGEKHGPRSGYAIDLNSKFGSIRRGRVKPGTSIYEDANWNAYGATADEVKKAFLSGIQSQEYSYKPIIGGKQYYASLDETLLHIDPQLVKEEKGDKIRIRTFGPTGTNTQYGPTMDKAEARVALYKKGLLESHRSIEDLGGAEGIIARLEDTGALGRSPEKDKERFNRLYGLNMKQYEKEGAGPIELKHHFYMGHIKAPRTPMEAFSKKFALDMDTASKEMARLDYKPVKSEKGAREMLLGGRGYVPRRFTLDRGRDHGGTENDEPGRVLFSARKLLELNPMETIAKSKQYSQKGIEEEIARKMRSKLGMVDDGTDRLEDAIGFEDLRKTKVEENKAAIAEKALANKGALLVSEVNVKKTLKDSLDDVLLRGAKVERASKGSSVKDDLYAFLRNDIMVQFAISAKQASNLIDAYSAPYLGDINNAQTAIKNSRKKK